MRQTFGCVTCRARWTSRLNSWIERSSAAIGGQDRLQRDVFAQLQILRLIEFAHAAPSQVADDAKA